MSNNKNVRDLRCLYLYCLIALFIRHANQIHLSLTFARLIKTIALINIFFPVVESGSETVYLDFEYIKKIKSVTTRSLVNYISSSVGSIILGTTGSDTR